MINLGDGPRRKKEANNQINLELFEAGITPTIGDHEELEIIDPESDAGRAARSGVYIPAEMKKAPRIKIVVFEVSGRLKDWEFRRAWYYWMAQATTKEAHIPVEDAIKLHEIHGQQLRVAGHCGCPPPEAPWLNSETGGMDHYHIDSQEALNALAEYLRKRKEESEGEVSVCPIRFAKIRGKDEDH